MSLPFYSIKCNGCEYEQVFSFSTLYEFENLYDDECQPFLKVAWCKDCDSLVTTANPQTENSISEEVQRLNEWIKEEESKRNQKKFGLFPKKPNQDLLQKWKSEVTNLTMSVSFFHYRDMKPKCLTCGGNHIIPTTDIHEVEQENVDIGIQHSCGGRILASYSGRMSFNTDMLPRVKYDIDGNMVSDTRARADKPNISSPKRIQPAAVAPTLLEEIKEIAKNVLIDSVVEKGLYSGFLILAPDEKSLIKLKEVKGNNEAVSAFVEIIEERITNNDFDDLLDHNVFGEYDTPPPTGDKGKSTAKRVLVGSNKTFLFQW